MRYFLDTEFIERGHGYPIELISIGLVAEDGREYYAVSQDFNPRHAAPWVKDNVLSLLPPRSCTPHLAGTRLFRDSQAWRPLSQIAADIAQFIGKDSAPEFWGYYSDYDWVVFCQIFGDMSNLPPRWPMYCRDLRQELDAGGFADMRQPDDARHDALLDARWVADTWRAHFGSLVPAERTA